MTPEKTSGQGVADLSAIVRRTWQQLQLKAQELAAGRGFATANGAPAPAGEGAAVLGLRAERSSTRWLSATALGRNSQRSPEAVAALVDALDDPEEFVRWQAAEALASQEVGRVFPLLTELLASEDPLRRRGAATAVGRLGGEAAALTLSKHLAEPDPAVRATIAEALGEAGDPNFAEALIPLLTDADAEVRRATAGALGRLGNSAATIPLAEALGRPGQTLLVRRAAAAALARAPHPDAGPALMAALADPDPQVRAYAAGALGQAGADSAVPALTRLKADRTPVLHGVVGDAAQQALTMLERRGRAGPAPGPAEGSR